MSHRLPDGEHRGRRWRIHEIAPDFGVEDVWALPVRGGPGDFHLLVEGLAEGDPAGSPSAVARALWALRWKLGEWFGWDEQSAGLGSRVAALRDRLPDDLRAAGRGPEFASLPFTSLYLLDDEFAAETANQTMHGVLHLGWVPDGRGEYRAQMAVLVKPNGRFGSAYMALIRPFRHLLVYPAAFRLIEREWQRRLVEARAAEAP